jgi:hypothetical protein
VSNISRCAVALLCRRCPPREYPPCLLALGRLYAPVEEHLLLEMKVRHHVIDDGSGLANTSCGLAATAPADSATAIPGTAATARKVPHRRRAVALTDTTDQVAGVIVPICVRPRLPVAR